MRTWTDLHIYINADIEITDYVSFIWTDKYNEPGDFELELPYTDINASLFHIDDILTCNLSSHSMIVEDIIVSIAPDTGKRMKVKGRSIESLLDRRVIADTFVVKNDSYSVNKFVQAITDAYTFATRNSAKIMTKGNNYAPKKDVAISGRELPITLQFSGIDGTHPDIDPFNHIYDSNIQIDGTGKDFLSILQENCKLMGFGFKLIAVTKESDIFRSPISNTGEEMITNNQVNIPLFLKNPVNLKEYADSELIDQINVNAYTMNRNQLTLYSNMFDSVDPSTYPFYLFGKNSLYTDDTTKRIDTPSAFAEKTRVYLAEVDHYQYGPDINYWCQDGLDKNGSVVQKVVSDQISSENTIYYIWRRTLNQIPHKTLKYDNNTSSGTFNQQVTVSDVVYNDYLWICIGSYIGNSYAVTPTLISDSSGREMIYPELKYSNISIPGSDFNLYLYDGHDISDSIEYSEENNNLSSFEYELNSTNYKNYAFVQGDEYEDSTDYVYIGGVAYETSEFEDDHFVDGATYKNDSEDDVLVYSKPIENIYYKASAIRPGESVTLVGPETNGFAKISESTDSGPRWVKYGRLTKDATSYKIFASSYDKEIDNSDSEYYKVGVNEKYYGGLERREIYLDSNLDKAKNTDIKYASRLNKYGVYELINNYKVSEESSCEIVHNLESMYEDAYNLGDIVNVKIDPIHVSSNYEIENIKMRITSYTITCTESGLDLYPSLENYDPNAYKKVNDSIEGFIEEGITEDFDSDTDVELHFYARGGNDGSNKNNANGGLIFPYGHWQGNDIMTILQEHIWTPLIWGANNKSLNYNNYKNKSNGSLPVYYSMDKTDIVEGIDIVKNAIVRALPEAQSNTVTGMVWAKLPIIDNLYPGRVDENGRLNNYWILISEPGHDYFEFLNGTQEMNFADAEQVWGLTHKQREGTYLTVPQYTPELDSHYKFIGWFPAVEGTNSYGEKTISRVGNASICYIYDDDKDNGNEPWATVDSKVTTNYIAAYERLKYKVTFKPGAHGKFLNAGIANQTSIDILIPYGDSIKTSDVPSVISKDDSESKIYKPTEWSPNNPVGTIVEEDLEFEMNWEEAPVKHKVSFSISYNHGYFTGYGTRQLTVSGTVDHGVTPTPPGIVLNEGVTFKYWSPNLHPAINESNHYTAKCEIESAGHGAEQDQGSPGGEDEPDSGTGEQKPPTKDDETGSESVIINDNMTYGDEAETLSLNNESSVIIPMRKFRAPIYKKEDTVKEINILEYPVDKNVYIEYYNTGGYNFNYNATGKYLKIIDYGASGYGYGSKMYNATNLSAYTDEQIENVYKYDKNYVYRSPGSLPNKCKILIKGKDNSAIENYFEKDLPAPTDSETGEVLNNYCDLYLQAYWRNIDHLPVLNEKEKYTLFGSGKIWDRKASDEIFVNFDKPEDYIPSPSGGSGDILSSDLRNMARLNVDTMLDEYVQLKDDTGGCHLLSDMCHKLGFGMALRRRNDDKILALLSFDYFSDDGIAEVAFTYNPIYIPFRKFEFIPENDAYNKFIPGLYYASHNNTMNRLWVPPSDWTSNKQNYYYRKQVGWYVGFCTQVYDDMGNIIDSNWRRSLTDNAYNEPAYIEYKDPNSQNPEDWHAYGGKPAYEVLCADPGHYFYPRLENENDPTDSPDINYSLRIKNLFKSTGWIFVPIYYDALKGNVSDDVVVSHYPSTNPSSFINENSIWKSLNASEAHTYLPSQSRYSAWAGWFIDRPAESYLDASCVYGPISGSLDEGIKKVQYNVTNSDDNSIYGETDLLFFGDGKSDRRKEKGVFYTEGSTLNDERYDNTEWSFSNGLDSDDTPISKLSSRTTAGTQDVTISLIKSMFDIAYNSQSSPNRITYLQAFEIPKMFSSNIVSGLSHNWQYSSTPSVERSWTDISGSNSQALKVKVESDSTLTINDDLNLPNTTYFRDVLHIEGNEETVLEDIKSDAIKVIVVNSVPSDMHEGDPDNPEEISVVGGLPDWFPNE